ncbi:hypothetical protein CDL60_01130 [Roseateles noduli]|nr:hypothetical protein CDL60_01130 [Roseateles noduli]
MPPLRGPTVTVPPPGPPQDSPFPLLDDCYVLDSRLDRERGEVRSRALRPTTPSCLPTRCSIIRIRPLGGPAQVTTSQQDHDLATVERLLLRHLRHARRPTRFLLSHETPLDEILETLSRIRRARALSFALAPDWTLDHHVLRTHHEPFARRDLRAHRFPEWVITPARFDHGSRPAWTSIRLGDRPNPCRVDDLPLPPTVRPCHPKASSHAVWVGFQFPDQGAHHLIARRLAHAPAAVLVQGDVEGRQRTFHRDRVTGCWVPGLQASRPDGKIRFVVVGHAAPALDANERRLSQLPASEVAAHLMRFVDHARATTDDVDPAWMPAHVSLCSCTLESPVSSYSYAEDLLRRLSIAWGTRELTVSARSATCGVEMEASADDAAGRRRLRPVIAFNDVAPPDLRRRDPRHSGPGWHWARHVPRATWLFRRGPQDTIERADKYPHGGKAWVTDDRVADPPPADALMAWLGPRPSDLPARPGGRRWESDRTHVMLGEVWIALDVLHRLGAVVDGEVPKDTASLAAPGTYARLRVDPVRLLAFVRAWPAPEDLIPGLRLLKQALRDEVPPLTPPTSTSTSPPSLQQLASLASAHALLRAVAMSVDDDLTIAERLWRHLQ